MRLLIGICSKNKNYEVNGTNDHAAYVQCLETDGTLVWQREVGPAFATVKPRFLDVNDDGVDEIVAQRTYIIGDDPEDPEFGSALLVLDISGNLLDSIDCHYNLKITTPIVMDIGSDGRSELLVPFRDGRLQVYDRQLHLVHTILSTVRLTPAICRDFAGDGRAELLLSDDDDRLYLLDHTFRQLARTENGGTADDVPPGKVIRPVEMIVKTRRGFRLYELSRTSWTLVFSRYPILAFLAAFLPLMLVLVIVVMFLQKRRRRLVAAYEHRLIEEKYLQAKTIAGGFAHEIRNALFPVRTVLARMKSHSGGGEAAPQATIDTTRQIDAAISRAIHLTDLVGQYAALEAYLRIEPVPLGPVVSDMLREHQQRIRALKVTTDIEDLKGCIVMAHANHVRTTISTLIQNSLDAFHETTDPKLTIYCEHDSGRSGDRDGRRLRLWLRDNGCGIATEHRDRIFDPFFSTRPATGKGLGLTLARRMAELSGGELHLESDSTAGVSDDSAAGSVGGTTMILVLNAVS